MQYGMHPNPCHPLLLFVKINPLYRTRCDVLMFLITSIIPVHLDDSQWNCDCMLFYPRAILHYQPLYLLESPTMTIKNASALPRGNSGCLDSENVKYSLNEVGFLYVTILQDQPLEGYPTLHVQYSLQ